MPKIKEAKSTCVGLLEIRLGASLLGTTRRLITDLENISQSVARIRNAYVWHWTRWREDNPDWQPEKPSELMPSEATKAIYRRLCDDNPNVATSIVACCMSRELKALMSNMPYNHIGKARKRWKALLAHEVSPQSAKGSIIPLHNRTIRLCYAGDMEGKATGPVGKQLAAFGQSSAVMALQLFSRSSGRVMNAFCRIETRQLPAGKRKILRRLARGDWEIRDSVLTYKEKQQAWFFQLTYKQPFESLDLDRERRAVLKLADKEQDQPFILTLGEDAPTWHLGFRVLEREYSNINTRRRNLRGKYRVAGSGRKGHGRRRIEYRIRSITHQGHDLMERFTDHVVADVMKFCVRHDCGTIDYSEPALMARAKSWFAARNIPYDWTRLLSQLSQKCTRYQIALCVNGKPS